MIFLAIFFNIIFSIHSYAYINIYPLTFDKRIDRLGEVQEFNLYNGTLKPLKYEIYIDKSTKYKDMSNWIEYYPKVITIKPGKEEILKIYIQSPKGTEKGEYSAILGIKELYFPDEEAMRKKESSLKIMTDLKIELFGFVGDIVSDLKIQNLSISVNEKSLNLNGYLENIGKRRATFKFFLSDSKNKNTFFIGEKRLLPNEKFSLEEFSQKITDEDVLKKIKRYKKFVIKENDTIIKSIKF